MKFIRDIIGEKRQSQGSIEGAPMPAAPAEDMRQPSMSAEFPDLAPSFPEEQAIDAGGPQIDEQAPVAERMTDEVDLGVNDEVAKFFAESEDESLFGDAFDDDYLGDDNDAGASAQASPHLDVADFEETAPEPVEDLAPETHDYLSAASNPAHEDQTSDETGTALNEVFRAEHFTAPQSDIASESAASSDPVAEADPVTEMPEILDTAPPAPPSQPAMSAFPPRPARPSETAAMAEPVSAPVADTPRHVEVPQPAVGRGASRHGRVKTRLLGFNAAMETVVDPMADNDKAGMAPYTSFPVGWLIVVDGPGRGSGFTLFHGVSTIGRGEDQTVRLDFGDNSISRESHASIAYDDRQKGFFIGHGGKANIVRRNDRPVLSTEELAAGDTITIGETTLRFVPFCGPDFSWEQETQAGPAYAHHA